MKTKIITLSIVAALLFSPGLNCAFAGDAFSQLHNASTNPGKAFDGSKSYLGSIANKINFTSKSAIKVPEIKDEVEPEPSTWEKVKEAVGEQQSNILMIGACATAGFFVAGPLGAAVGVGFMLFLILV